MGEELVVKFWGVRGSHPTPGETTVKYGGNTPCVEVRPGGRIVILDAGTGIIPLGRETARHQVATGSSLDAMLLLSHAHHDHIQGFPFFMPAYLPTTRLQIFGPGRTPDTLARLMEDNQSTTSFPVSLDDMAAEKHILSVQETEVIVWSAEGIHLAAPGEPLSDEALVVRIHRSYAHPGGVYAYRLAWRGKSIVYATDVEGYAGTDRRLVDFARGADLLIHDAQYSEEHYRGEKPGFPATQGYGHSTARMACEVARAAGVHRLVLFHHEPAYDDAAIRQMEAAARRLFEPCLAAFEGLEIRLAAPPSTHRRMAPLSPRPNDRTG